MTVKERPILFNGEMVRAIIAGRKTQTRRVMKPQPDSQAILIRVENEATEYVNTFDVGKSVHRVPYEVGDRLWVREAFMTCARGVEYKADFDFESGGWKPSIHMPRCASRITLEITGVRAERLRDISEEDGKVEGVWTDEMYADRVGDGELPEIHCPQCFGEGTFVSFSGWGASEADCDLCDTVVKRFRLLWDSLAKPGEKWADNLWVWVIEFRRVENV